MTRKRYEETNNRATRKSHKRDRERNTGSAISRCGHAADTRRRTAYERPSSPSGSGIKRRRRAPKVSCVGTSETQAGTPDYARMSPEFANVVRATVATVQPP